jgi:putative ABC transport system permease protein
MFDNIRVALDGLRGNKLRSALTMLGITIGVASVIILVSVGQAVESYIVAQFSGLGANLVFVVGRSWDDSLGSLTQRDADAVADPFRVPDAQTIMPQRSLNASEVSGDGVEAVVDVQGITPDYVTVFERDAAAGRFITQADLDSFGRVAILGVTTVNRFFPDTVPIGQTVRVRGLRFTVIGVLEFQGGSSVTGGDADDVILVPLTTAQFRLSGTRTSAGDRPVSFITVKARDAASVDDVAQQIRLTLREERDISFRDEDDFLVFTQSEILGTFNRITGLVTLFLALLAGISLLVGGIGIMNIMLVTVTERTREVGLRKAVGARNGDILLQFLTEATTLAVIGGAVGVAIAFGVSSLVTSLVPGLNVAVRPASIALATAISAAIGMMFGVYPAQRASRLDPIDALRHE